MSATTIGYLCLGLWMMWPAVSILSRRSAIVAAMTLACACATLGMNSNSSLSDPRNERIDIVHSPSLVVGADACAKCHAAEINVWKQTPHHETFLTLHRKPQAQEIAKKM